VTVLDSLEVGEFKTRRVAELLAKLGLEAASVLVVISEPDPFVERSARNLPNVSVVRQGGLNVYDVLRHQRLLLTQEAVNAVQERLAVAAKETA
jgi:large subunit ribosomal protein L4